MLEHGREDVVTLGEDVGRDDDFIADGPLDREPAGVDLRADTLDHHPRGGAATHPLCRAGLRLHPCPPLAGPFA